MKLSNTTTSLPAVDSQTDIFGHAPEQITPILLHEMDFVAGGGAVVTLG